MLMSLWHDYAELIAFILNNFISKFGMGVAALKDRGYSQLTSHPQCSDCSLRESVYQVNPTAQSWQSGRYNRVME